MVVANNALQAGNFCIPMALGSVHSNQDLTHRSKGAVVAWLSHPLPGCQRTRLGNILRAYGRFDRARSRDSCGSTLMTSQNGTR